MSRTAPPAPPEGPRAVDHVASIEQWRRDWSRRDEPSELVDGQPTMSPREHRLNIRAARRLGETLMVGLDPSWEWLGQMGVLIASAPQITIRYPDLALARPGSTLDTDLLAPSDIQLAAEVLSPATRHVDLGRKRRDYAGVGIPLHADDLFR